MSQSDPRSGLLQCVEETSLLLYDKKKSVVLQFYFVNTQALTKKGKTPSKTFMSEKIAPDPSQNDYVRAPLQTLGGDFAVFRHHKSQLHCCPEKSPGQ